MRHRRGRPLTRRTATRDELRTIVLFCEGVNTEPDYFKAVKKLPTVRSRTSVRIELDPEHGAPVHLVRCAVERLRDEEVDECWCVFDVEWPQNHPNLEEAVKLAEEHGVGLAISNPCFELWLILHHRPHTAFLDNRGAQRDCRALGGIDGKRIDAEAVYMPLRQHAVRRAEQLTRRHVDNRVAFPADNPSSSVFRLMRALEPPDSTVV
ncbi:RloB family protein [Nocardia arizonensis]|uniref:RloB family protein n=1 Tax=Nocardia arizonensis TaxID=1141647 RepID=UPI0009E7EA05|nr:RloB family protein [Nocardia arizonensis]